MRRDRRWLDSRDASIRRRHSLGCTVQSLAHEFGLSRATIYEAIHGGARVEVPDEPLAEWEIELARQDEWPAPPPETGPPRDVYRGYRGRCVYVVQSGDDGPLKIGVTNYPGVEARVASLQTGNPETLRIRRVFVGDESLEVALHAHFRDLHIRGEWFRCEGELADLLAPYDAHDLRAEAAG